MYCIMNIPIRQSAHRKYLDREGRHKKSETKNDLDQPSVTFKADESAFFVYWQRPNTSIVMEPDNSEGWKHLYEGNVS